MEAALEDPRRGTTRIVPLIVKLNTFLDGGRRSFMFTWIFSGTEGGRASDMGEKGGVFGSGVACASELIDDIPDAVSDALEPSKE